MMTTEKDGEVRLNVSNFGIIKRNWNANNFKLLSNGLFEQWLRIGMHVLEFIVLLGDLVFFFVYSGAVGFGCYPNLSLAEYFVSGLSFGSYDQVYSIVYCSLFISIMLGSTVHLYKLISYSVKRWGKIKEFGIITRNTGLLIKFGWLLLSSFSISLALYDTFVKNAWPYMKVYVQGAMLGCYLPWLIVTFFPSRMLYLDIVVVGSSEKLNKKKKSMPRSLLHEAVMSLCSIILVCSLLACFLPSTSKAIIVFEPEGLYFAGVCKNGESGNRLRCPARCPFANNSTSSESPESIANLSAINVKWGFRLYEEGITKSYYYTPSFFTLCELDPDYVKILPQGVRNATNLPEIKVTYDRRIAYVDSYWNQFGEGSFESFIYQDMKQLTVSLGNTFLSHAQAVGQDFFSNNNVKNENANFVASCDFTNSKYTQDPYVQPWMRQNYSWVMVCMVGTFKQPQSIGCTFLS